MSEKYKPTQEEFQKGRSMMSPEETQMSRSRELAFYEVDDVDALKDSELYLDVKENGNEVTVVGRVRDHDILMTCQGMNGMGKKYIVKIDAYPPVEEEDLARTLFNKYYQIAKAQAV